MTLEQIYYIAEIIAVTGILISLLFVLRQLKQTQAQLERSEQSNILENAIASREFAMALARDGELSDIVHRGRRGMDNLTHEEKPRFINYVLAVCMLTQAGHALGWSQFKDKTDEHSERMWDVFYMQISQTMQTLDCEGGREFITRFGYLFAPRERKMLMACAGLGPIPDLAAMPKGMRVPERYDLIEGGKWAGVTASQPVSGVAQEFNPT